MTIPMEVMAELASIGLSPEQARAVAGMLSRVEEATKAEGEVGKEKARARWRNWKERQSTNVGKRLPTTANVSQQLASAEDRTSKTQIEPQEENKKRAGRDAVEFRSELADLDSSHLDALVAHRKFKKAPLTKRAAELFRRDVEKAGLSLAEAVDTCISRNWITVKPEWLGDRRQQAPPARPINPTLAAALKLQEKFDAVSPSEIEGNHAPPRLMAVGGRAG